MSPLPRVGGTQNLRLIWPGLSLLPLATPRDTHLGGSHSLYWGLMQGRGLFPLRTGEPEHDLQAGSPGTADSAPRSPCPNSALSAQVGPLETRLSGGSELASCTLKILVIEFCHLSNRHNALCEKRGTPLGSSQWDWGAGWVCKAASTPVWESWGVARRSAWLRESRGQQCLFW